MNIKYYYLLPILFVLLSCEESLPLNFNSNNSYIYFNIPFEKDNYGKDLTTRVDSIEYSFSLEGPEVSHHILKVPVSIAGFANENDREFSVEVVDNETTAAKEDWDIESIENPVFRKGAMSDTLYIKLNRTPELKDKKKSITISLKANENFNLGETALTSVKISFSDILQPPTWYNAWRNVFGLVFYREVYVKWQEIYYLGADPNVETLGGPGMGQPLWWDNMPYYANQSWYPSTFLFVRTLKQYFLDNIVYPEGDESKPRILIP